MRALLVVLAALLGMGQTASRAVDVAPIVDSDGVPAGRVVRVAVKVELPAGFHVQSDTPRDPTLIATMLGIDPPPGIEALDVAYPASSDFAQEGSPQPLSVFGRQFLIGARLRVAAAEPPGEKRVPARLRYQMCDDKMCFKPISVDLTWTLRIVAPTASRDGDTCRVVRGDLVRSPGAAANARQHSSTIRGAHDGRAGRPPFDRLRARRRRWRGGAGSVHDSRE